VAAADGEGAIQPAVSEGAADAIDQYCSQYGNRIPLEIGETVKAIANSAGTPLLVSEDYHSQWARKRLALPWPESKCCRARTSLALCLPARFASEGFVSPCVPVSFGEALF